MDWLRGRRKPQTNPQRPVVTFDAESITCRRPTGLVETVKWSDLRVVLIQTTANGPAVDDLFWMLLGEKGGCVVPSEAIGAEDLLTKVRDLPDFDYESAINAMKCTDEREFLCWQKPL